MFFKYCPQTNISILVLILGYIMLFSVRGGFGIFLEWEKYNWWFDILYCTIYVLIIHVLCITNFKKSAWVLIGIMVISNIYSFLNKKTILASEKKTIDIEKKYKVGLFQSMNILDHHN